MIDFDINIDIITTPLQQMIHFDINNDITTPVHLMIHIDVNKDIITTPLQIMITPSRYKITLTSDHTLISFINKESIASNDTFKVKRRYYDNTTPNDTL